MAVFQVFKRKKLDFKNDIQKLRNCCERWIKYSLSQILFQQYMIESFGKNVKPLLAYKP